MIITDIQFHVTSFRFEEPMKVAFATIVDMDSCIVKVITDEGIVGCGEGRRINFADNDQVQGVFSAADAYSVFYGAGAEFFELETLAPVQFDAGLRTTGSVLESETHFYRGPQRQIASLLKDRFDFDLDMEHFDLDIANLN